MSRAYRIILIFSIVIQLSLFFIVVAVALWIDQIYNGDIGKLTTRAEAFRGIDMYVQVRPCDSVPLMSLQYDPGLGVTMAHYGMFLSADISDAVDS